MTKRISILQTTFLRRSYSLPNDVLLIYLLPQLRPSSPKPAFGRNCTIRNAILRMSSSVRPFASSLTPHLRGLSFLPPPQYHPVTCLPPEMGVDPVLWLSMSRKGRSHCVRQRISRLPVGNQDPANVAPTTLADDTWSTA